MSNLQQSQLQEINVNLLSEKCKSKKELYQFLTQDCSAFLPPIQSTNIYFFKDIIRGSKDYIKRENVLVSAVPHIEGLTIEDFIQFAKTKPQYIKFLPNERDWVHMDRQWICDVLYTLDKQGIQIMINKAMKERKDKLEHNRDLIVQMRPEFVQALNSCLNFSHERGKASNLLKGSSKRKRRRDEIEEVKEEEQQLKENKHDFLQQVKRLKTEKEQLEQQLQISNQENQQILSLMNEESQSQQQLQFQI